MTQVTKPRGEESSNFWRWLYIRRRHVGRPSHARFRLVLGSLPWNVWNVNHVVATRTLDLPAGKLFVTRHALLAVRTFEFEFAHIVAGINTAVCFIRQADCWDLNGGVRSSPFQAAPPRRANAQSHDAWFGKPCPQKHRILPRPSQAAIPFPARNQKSGCIVGPSSFEVFLRGLMRFGFPLGFSDGVEIERVRIGHAFNGSGAAGGFARGVGGDRLAFAKLVENAPASQVQQPCLEKDHGRIAVNCWHVFKDNVCDCII